MTGDSNADAAHGAANVPSAADQWLSVQDAVDRSGLSALVIRFAIRSGELPARWVVGESGREPRVTQRSLDTFVQRRSAQAASLSLREAVARSGLPATILNLAIQRGELPVQQVDGPDGWEYRIRAEDLDAFAGRRAAGGAPRRADPSTGAPSAVQTGDSVSLPYASTTAHIAARQPPGWQVTLRAAIRDFPVVILAGVLILTLVILYITTGSPVSFMTTGSQGSAAATASSSPSPTHRSALVAVASPTPPASRSTVAAMRTPPAISGSLQRKRPRASATATTRVTHTYTCIISGSGRATIHCTRTTAHRASRPSVSVTLTTSFILTIGRYGTRHQAVMQGNSSVTGGLTPAIRTAIFACPTPTTRQRRSATPAASPSATTKTTVTISSSLPLSSAALGRLQDWAASYDTLLSVNSFRVAGMATMTSTGASSLDHEAQRLWRNLHSILGSSYTIVQMQEQHWTTVSGGSAPC